jgi:microsomal dipeptidase-like Zn-dependent dipeptidase
MKVPVCKAALNCKKDICDIHAGTDEQQGSIAASSRVHKKNLSKHHTKYFFINHKINTMPNIDFSIDLHAHPTYKALGRSFQNNPGNQSNSVNDKNSLWHYDPPTLIDKLLNVIGSLTKFSQANFTAGIYGKLWVITVGMGTIEKWFFNNKLGTGIISDILDDFAAELGKPRIDAIQGMQNYFTDLMQEYAFLEQMHNRPLNIDGKDHVYRIVNNFSELKAAVEENDMNIAAENGKPLIIALILSIEGMHVLNCGIDPDRSPTNIKANADEVKQHARDLKNHSRKPWFITFSHHFYNELCGQSLSLRGLIAKACDQSVGLSTGFTDLGKEVLDILLNNSEGKRILIDIKHLSPLGRQQFFKIREEKYPDIPVFISHGVANGLPDMNSVVSNYPELGNTFNNVEINFYDDEILLMAQTGGIIGLQLDERRLTNEETLKRTRHSIFRNKIMHYRSELLWRQVQYIAELLDDHGMYAWGNMCIGSDYDGIVDPLNSFWTIEQYPELKSYLERHAFNYMQNESGRLKNSFNIITADLIVQAIFQGNGWAFFEILF